MDLSNILASLQSSLGGVLPNMLAALGILVVGWLVAVVVRAAIRKSLSFMKINARIQESTSSSMDIESGIASGVYYLVMLMVLIGFFSSLELEIVSGPLEGLASTFFEFVPKLVAGGVLILIAWLVATIVRVIVTKALAATTLDEKISAEAGMKPVSASLSNVLYWLIFLIFLPAILSAFDMQGLLAPVQGMVDKILGMLPNIFAAGIIGFVGWFVARILRDLVSNLLASVGADSVGENVGLNGTMTLSNLVGLVVFVFVFVPVLISALNALQIEAISGPATEMLSAMMNAIPNIFAAGIILVVAFFVSRFISTIISSLLGGIGFDNLPSKLGMNVALSEGATPSSFVGKLIIFYVMLFATVEAASMIGFGQVEKIVGMFIQFGGQILLGVVILAVGFWLANLTKTAIMKVSGNDASGMANLARFAILGLVFAMGLRAMGIADDIVNIAFTLVLGAIAVAVALSFGLGGREAAGKQMEFWLEKLRK